MRASESVSNSAKRVPSLLPLISLSGAVLLFVGAAAQAAGLLETLLERNPRLTIQVNESALKKATRFYDANERVFKNKDYLTVVDFTLSSRRPRMHVINIRSGEVESLLVSHGVNSGGDIPRHFSNILGSNMSSVGAYLTLSMYDGKHGNSLHLQGMEASNQAALARDIVVHGAEYVSERIAREQARLGRSQGCLALDYKVIDRIVRQLDGQSLIYVYSDSAYQNMSSAQVNQLLGRGKKKKK